MSERRGKRIYRAIGPIGTAGDIIEIDASPAQFYLNESGRDGDAFQDDCLIIKCFTHRRARLWYVFELESGMLISSIGKPSRAEALEQAERLCSEHGIKGTESAIDMAIKSFGVLNYA